MSNLLNLKFWFALRPGALIPLSLKILIFTTVLFFLGFLITLVLNKFLKDKLKRKISEKLNSFFISNFVIFLFLLFFNYEEIPFLSARFWFLIWFLGALTWIFFIVRHLASIPKQKEDLAKKREYEKYIP